MYESIRKQIQTLKAEQGAANPPEITYAWVDPDGNRILTMETGKPAVWDSEYLAKVQAEEAAAGVGSNRNQ